MSDQAGPADVRDPDRIGRAIHGDPAISAMARALVAAFSPSHLFVTDDLLDEALCRVLRSKGRQPDWDDPDAVRRFLRRVMKNLLTDRLRRPEGSSIDEDAEDRALADRDLSRRIDLVAAFVELDRTDDPALARYFATFRLHNFAEYRGRFSKEGGELLAGFEKGTRSLAEVGEILGIGPSGAFYHVSKITMWLENRLREYRPLGADDAGEEG